MTAYGRSRNPGQIDPGVVRANFPAGLVAYWSARDLAPLGDSTAVNSWTDRIAGIALSASGSQRPTYRSTGLLSKPSVQFDGSDDRLVVAASNPVSTTSSGHVIAVAAVSSGGVWGTGDDDSNNRYMLGVKEPVGSQFRMQVASGGGGADIAYTTSYPNSSARVYEWQSTGSAWSILFDNVTQSLTGTNVGKWFSHATQRDRFAAGCLVYNGTENNFLTGHISELFVIDGAMNASERLNLYGWLTSEYGIP